MKKVIIISGKLRAGKDTLASFMMEEFSSQNKELVHDFFARRLKEGATEDFKGLQTVVNTMVDEIALLPSIINDLGALSKLSELKWKDENYLDIKTPITRALLQLYGTEIFRMRVNDNHWVDLVVDGINKSEEEFFVLTDARFENEIYRVMEKCEDTEVITIRVERNLDRGDSANEHISEKGLDNYEKWDYIVNNFGSLDELTETAKGIADEIIKRGELND
jgi:dephospho-CoA kinase